MATYNAGKVRTFIAGEDLTAAQYRFVTLESDGQVDLADAAGEQAIGVLMNNPAATQAATVALDGRVLVEAGGTVTNGGPVATNAAGEAVNATTGNIVMGYALESGVDGQIIAIELIQGGNAAA